MKKLFRNTTKKENFIEYLLETYGEDNLDSYIQNNDILYANEEFLELEISAKSITDLYKLNTELLEEFEEEYKEHLSEISGVRKDYGDLAEYYNN